MENTTCPACSGEGQLLGQLGSLNHFRCCNCGADFNSAAEVENHLESFEEALARFVFVMQQAINEYFRTEYPGLHLRGQVPQLVVDPNGVKYVRVVQRDKGSEHGSAWCFVEVATGNILKCDGYKRPAKGVRGSIYAKDFNGYGCTTYGPKYAR
jgi:hypothetical protein